MMPWFLEWPGHHPERARIVFLGVVYIRGAASGEPAYFSSSYYYSDSIPPPEHPVEQNVLPECTESSINSCFGVYNGVEGVILNKS